MENRGRLAGFCNRTCQAHNSVYFAAMINIPTPAHRSIPLPEMLQAAAAAWKRREYQRSIELLERAGRAAPHKAEIWFDLARCHGLCYNFEAAEECFEKGIRATGWKAESLLEAGRRCLAFSQYEMAQKYFERTLKKDGNSIETLMRLAGIHLRHNRLDEALRLSERVQHLNRDFMPALHLRATLYRLNGQLIEAENLLRSLTGKPAPDPWTCAQVWFELGTTLDLQRRYDDAMAAFIEAKKWVRSMMSQNAINTETKRENLEKVAQTLSADMLARWRKAGTTFQPQYRFSLLCGHPRSGTTLLEQVLDSHPEIVSIEETLIFNEEAFLSLTHDLPQEMIFPFLDSTSTGRLHKTRTDYFRCAGRFLGQPIGTRLLIDKNPSLTCLIPAVIRLIPEAKFLVAIRDPRDICISCFTQSLMPMTPISKVFPTLETTAAEYAAIMGFWQTLKPIMPSPFLEVRYEDLAADLGSVARRTLEFLEVPWDDRVLAFQKHTEHKLVRSPTFAEVRKPVTKRAVGRWRNYQKYLEPYLPVLEPFVKAFGYE